MGSGKSHIGRIVSAKLGLRFEDLDKSIQAEQGLSIGEIFARNGEGYFRDIERRTLLQKISDDGRVLSLGGGSLSDQSIVDHIKKENILVYVSPPFDEILKRIQGKRKRPLVMNPDGSAKSLDQLRFDLKALYDQRSVYYNQAHIILNTQPEWDPYQSASALLNLLNNRDDAV